MQGNPRTGGTADARPEARRAAIEQALAGGNAAAQVSAVKLLGDLDVYDRECPTCARNAAVDMGEVRAKLDALIERDAAHRAAEVTQDLEARLEAVKAEHAA